MNTGDLGYALIISLFGMAVVFIVLIGLSFMTNTLSIIAKKGNKKKLNEVKLASNVIISTDSEDSDEDELIAAVTAVAMICMEGNGGSFTVRSIRKVKDHTPVWGKVSRHEQMQNRF